MSTWDRGLRLFERWASENPSVLSGEKVFQLYDTYGFPVDLTQLIAKERGLQVDVDGFETAMLEQKKRSKAAQKKVVVALAQDYTAKTEFVGYDREKIKNWSSLVEAVTAEAGNVYLTLESSSFYGEKGGQIGDIGTIYFADGRSCSVVNTLWNGSVLVHAIEGLAFEELQQLIGTKAKLMVNYERRLQITRHHTATHLLHWALRKVLGEHVHQAGSLVTDQSLRFDFSHFEKLSEDQLATIERLCNEKILENVPVISDEIDFDKRPEDCLAFFEDKYGDRVRVVKIGDFSTELCGGTHVSFTGELGQLKIVQETSIASGVRRIEAIAGQVAYEFGVQLSRAVKQLEKQMDCSLDFVFERYQRLNEQKQDLESKCRQMLRKNVGEAVEQVADVQNLHCVQLQIQIADMQLLRSLGKSYFSQNKTDILLAAGEVDDKGIVVVFCSEQAIQQGYVAGGLIQKFLKPLGANGGGKPDFASGGIKEVGQLRSAWKTFNWHHFLP